MYCPGKDYFEKIPVFFLLPVFFPQAFEKNFVRSASLVAFHFPGRCPVVLIFADLFEIPGSDFFDLA
jgi:hypothetical protein